MQIVLLINYLKIRFSSHIHIIITHLFNKYRIFFSYSIINSVQRKIYILKRDIIRQKL